MGLSLYGGVTWGDLAVVDLSRARRASLSAHDLF